MTLMHLQVDAEVHVSGANQKNHEFPKVLNSNYEVQEKESVDVHPIMSRMSQESSKEEVKERTFVPNHFVTMPCSSIFLQDTEPSGDGVGLEMDHQVMMQ